jgi:hypothetical protein
MTVMTEDQAEGQRVDRLMADIARIAPYRAHHLTKDMVDGSRRLTVPAALMVLNHLDKSRKITPAQVPVAAASPIPPRLGDFKGLVPKGYYATPSRTGNNDYDFWRVDPGKDRWEGFAFPVRVLGGGDGDSMRTVDLDNMQKRLALQAIVDYGIEEAAMLFAAKLMRCSDCGLALTDEESRRYGKGRVCRNKKS